MRGTESQLGKRRFQTGPEGRARFLPGLLLLLGLLSVAAPARSELVTEEKDAPNWVFRPFERALYLIGGLELNGEIGRASVSSSYRDSAGGAHRVASGSERLLGWGVSLTGPPRKTGFSIGPNLGYFDQPLALQDFRADLPWPQSQDPGVSDLVTDCQDPSSGAPVECGAPNSYLLRLRSAYAGLFLGYRFLWRFGPVDPYLIFELNGNLLAFHKTDVQLAGQSSRRSTLPFVPSAGGLMQLGVYLRPLHLAVTFAGVAEFYRSFRFKQALEFRGPPQQDPASGVWLRPRVFVERARLSLTSWRASLIWVFK